MDSRMFHIFAQRTIEMSQKLQLSGIPQTPPLQVVPRASGAPHIPSFLCRAFVHLLHTSGQAFYLYHLSHGHMNPIIYPVFREVSNMLMENLAAWPRQELSSLLQQRKRRGQGKEPPLLCPPTKSPLLTVLVDPSRHFCVNTILFMFTL